MRYKLKQKLFCFGDDFRIQDASGRDVFYVDGKAFTLLRNKLSFQDLQGNELAFIRERVLSLHKSYEIHRNGRLAAVVKKDLFTLFHCQFTVDVPGPDDLRASGGLLDHEYVFERHGRKVAEVSKKWFSIMDTYGVDIADGEDDILILASTVAIDMMCHGDKAADQH